MKKLLGKAFGLLLLCFLCFTCVTAQEDLSENQSYFEEFQNTQTAKERFSFFFNTANRYNQNSGFDWLDEVKVYVNDSEKITDTLAVNYYKTIQAQIHYDIGEYDKSLATSKELHQVIENWDLETKTILLDLMDQTYSQLELYPDQINIRKEKKELGISDNVTFHDIYSNLGLHRKAMKFYIAEEKKKIADKDYFGEAVFDNNVGNYLRLDKSYPTALNRRFLSLQFHQRPGVSNDNGGSFLVEESLTHAHIGIETLDLLFILIHFIANLSKH